MKRRFVSVAVILTMVALTVCSARAGDGGSGILDLTQLSGTVVYSQVYDMMMRPDAYTGDVVRVRGPLSYFQDPATKKEYFAVVIADATACCSQGMEFVWKGDHVYPRDYPPTGTVITVTGTFEIYWEYGLDYIQLTDAEVEW